MATQIMTQTEALTTAGRRGPRRGGQRTKSYHLRLGAWWWALPALVLMVVVIYITTVAGGFFAFTNWTGIGGFDFVGLQNFIKIFQTPELVGSLWNTLFLAVGFLVFTNLFGL